MSSLFPEDFSFLLITSTFFLCFLMPNRIMCQLPTALKKELMSQPTGGVNGPSGRPALGRAVEESASKKGTACNRGNLWWLCPSIMIHSSYVQPLPKCAFGVQSMFAFRSSWNDAVWVCAVFAVTQPLGPSQAQKRQNGKPCVRPPNPSPAPAASGGHAL